MKTSIYSPPSHAAILKAVSVAAVLALGSSHASAQAFTAGDVVISASTYQGNASTITIGESLPGTAGAHATANGSYPNFTQNDTPDGNFGITSPLNLIEINPLTQQQVQNYNVTAATGVVTSFTSKSEGSLNLSQDGTALTVMGYDSTINQLDISNSNTPGDPNGSKDTAPATYRAIAQVNVNGTSSKVDTSLYAGDNPRAAILASTGNYYSVGNSGDPSTTPLNDGAQLVTPAGTTTSLGQYNITQNGATADKLAKDNNFRGETIFNNTLYVSKGSGSNGIDTVYQVGTKGTLPTGSSNAITVLPGLNTKPAKPDGTHVAASDFTHPFGLYFANATTLYVGDEGSTIASDLPGGTTAGQDGQEFAGLDKYTLVNGSWMLDYVLTTGLQMGTAYTVSGTTPGGDTGSYTVLSTDGLRDISGRVNADGTVTIFGVTSTVSNNADQGADPNKIVDITDLIANTNATVAQSTESFNTLASASYGQVFRGVVVVPEPSTYGMLGLGLLGLVGIFRFRKLAA